MLLQTSVPTLQTPLPLLITGFALALLIVAFIVWFLVPAIRHWLLLRAIQKNLNGLSGKNPEELKKVFAVDVRLAHLWSEYQETLHSQTEDRDGQARVVAVRSTVPAESYFNSQYVVDSRLRTEFFRHLPGVLTGIGIIGTFSGLIPGLRQFQEGMGSSLQTTQALGNLLQEVSTAFFVSAAAIVSAMLVTLIEKLLISSLYHQAEDISHDIDARFNSGAGEEYLSRIVHASEDSASQSKILKDALVNDLRDLLREIANTQIRASKEDNQVLANTISGSIAESLYQPLKDIAGTVRTASGDQSAASSRMLQDVLTSFGQRLNDLFGGQISGINELNRDTAQGMQNVVQTLNVLVTNIESANARSSDTMAQRMADAVEKMERRQESINSQTASFVEQLRQLVSTSQTETNQKMQVALAGLGNQVGEMVASIKAGSEHSLESSRLREDSMADRTTSAVATMTGSVDSAVKEMSAASIRMQDAVSMIAKVTTSAIEKMNYGADTLNSASGSFARAGEGVASTMGQASIVAGKLGELAGAMNAGASALHQITEDYRAQRDGVTNLVTELRVVIELAKREASLTVDVLSRIESATANLATAQHQADQYLQEVSKVLGEAHQAFADATLRTLDRANIDFHSKLSSGVALLSASIQELDTTIGAR